MPIRFQRIRFLELGKFSKHIEIVTSSSARVVNSCMRLLATHTINALAKRCRREINLVYGVRKFVSTT